MWTETTLKKYHWDGLRYASDLLLQPQGAWHLVGRLRGLSIKELARQLGVDEGTLAKWENGEREPARNRMEIVEAFL